MRGLGTIEDDRAMPYRAFARGLFQSSTRRVGRARHVAVGALQAVALCIVVLTVARAVGTHGGTIPVAALGIALLFGLLAVRAVKPAWLEPGAPFLARHLGLFFVPILVSVGLAWPLPLRLILPVFANLALSTTAGLIVTGLVFQAGCREKRS